jgi:phage baseplate assembly protein W
MGKIIPNPDIINNDSLAIGFSIPINGPAVFNKTYQTKDQIKYNLINYLLINHGEILFKPNFGGNLRSLLFENITQFNLESKKERIEDDIMKYFSFIKVKDITFENFNNGSLNFILTYSIPYLGVDDYINILINNE